MVKLLKPTILILIIFLSVRCTDLTPRSACEADLEDIYRPNCLGALGLNIVDSDFGWESVAIAACAVYLQKRESCEEKSY